jgi:hypothetical protein
METLYRKKENGRYEETSISYTDDLSDGLWLVQTKPHSRSITSLFWKVGDLKRVADVTTHAALLGFQDQLTTYLSKLKDKNSPEYKDAKERLGGYLYGPVQLDNISASDLCSLFLRQIAINIETSNEQTR